MDSPEPGFYRLTRFTPLDSFKCSSEPGCDELQEFLKEDALPQQLCNVNQTVLAYIDDVLVGYYALSCHTVQIERAEERSRYGLDETEYARFPAVLLGRLAVHDDYRNRGIGKKLLLHAVSRALNVADIVGCRFLIAHAYEHRVSWYERNRFEVFHRPKSKIELPLVFMRFDLFPVEPQK